MEPLAGGATRRTSSKRRLDLAVEVASFSVAAGVLSLSIACTADGCLDVCLGASRVYSTLMFLTCVIVGLGRHFWPDVDLVRTEAAISCLRVLLTGPLAIPAVYLQAESLKDDIWLRTFHFGCSGMCALYVVTVAPLPLLHRATCPQVAVQQREQQLGDCDALATHTHLDLVGAGPADDCEKTRRTCCICYDRPANAMCLPCRHAGTCEVCLARLLRSPKPKCPLCRAAVASYDITVEDSYLATFIAPPKAAFGPAEKLPFCRPHLRSYIRLCCPALCAASHAPMLSSA
uniref:RING-type domain-containing protein n=1 Tax=Alexandrium catenella TaxID=2925 RepID=A0A7S1S5E4_ALECA